MSRTEDEAEAEEANDDSDGSISAKRSCKVYSARAEPKAWVWR